MSAALTPGGTADRIRSLEQSGGFESDVNVGPIERIACGVAGTALALVGVRKGRAEGAALALLGGALAFRAWSGYCPMYDALGVSTPGKSRLWPGADVHRGLKVQKTFTIQRTPEECYAFWRNFENLPRFMSHLKSVQTLDEQRSRWTAASPLGGSVTWDATIITDRPNELIAWRSVEGSEIDNAGSVRFRPGPNGRGTEVTVELNYEPPGGQLGASIAWLLGEEPEYQVREDLRKFKQILEAGEIPTVQGQPTG